MSSGIKSSSKTDQYQGQLITPQRSGFKQEPIPFSQNKSVAKSEQRQESTRNKQVPLPPFVDIPPRSQSPPFSFIMLRRFQLDSTITRAWICKFILLLTIKILSILTAIVFWLTVPIYLKTLLSWQAPRKILYELTLRYFSDSPSTSSIWRHIFPGSDFSNSYHLRLTVHSTGYIHSPTLYSTAMTIIIDNPLIWLFVMVFMFISHHLLCFAHDCLSKVSPTIRSAN